MTSLEKLPQAFRSLFFSSFLSLSWSFSCMDRCSAGTSMLSGDKVLFFTKPPSVAQARPIRRQWLVNSSQSGGKPRRDRGNGVILLMNYLSGQNNNVLSPPLLTPTSLSSLYIFLSRSVYFYFILFGSTSIDVSRNYRTNCSRIIFHLDAFRVTFIFGQIKDRLRATLIYENLPESSTTFATSYRLKCFQ